MVSEMNTQQESRASTAVTRRRRIAWILVLIVDLSFVWWGAMAALAPGHLLGPGGAPIVATEYEGFTGHSWSELVSTSPTTAAFATVIFRVYGAYNVAFGLLGIFIAVTAFRRGERWAWWALLAGNSITLISAMIFDYTMRAIGPFEMTEYLGLAMVWTALAITARDAHPSAGRNAPGVPVQVRETLPRASGAPPTRLRADCAACPDE